MPPRNSPAGAPPPSNAGTRLRLDIVSDTICPWCWVGKRRLAAALTGLAAEGLHVDATWRPFQLNPSMPAAGVERHVYRVAKFGSVEKGRALDAQVAAVGATEGLSFRHDLMARTPNTLASHALIRLAHEIGGASLQDRVVEALFRAYFSQGRDVGDHGVLTTLGEEAGLDREGVTRRLSDPAAFEAVTQDESAARRLGLDGVPSVILDGHLLFSGAQPTPVIARALREASEVLASRGAAASRPGLDRALA